MKRLNVDGRGKYLGEFDGDDKILQVNAAGWYELTSFDLSNHFDPGIVLMQKFDPEKVFGLVHYDTKAKNYFVKRFVFEMQPAGKEVSIISEEPGSKLIFITGKADAKVQIEVEKGKSKTPETLVLDLANLIDVKGLKANGNRVSQHEVKAVLLVDAGNEIGTEMVDFNQASADVEVQVNEVTPKEKSEESADTALVEEVVVDSEASETTDPDLSDEVLVKKKPVFKTEKIEDPADKKVVKPVLEEVVEEIKAPEKPVEPKRVDFEITNPDDIKIDDKGQSLLF